MWNPRRVNGEGREVRGVVEFAGTSILVKDFRQVRSINETSCLNFRGLPINLGKYLPLMDDGRITLSAIQQSICKDVIW